MRIHINLIHKLLECQLESQNLSSKKKEKRKHTLKVTYSSQIYNTIKMKCKCLKWIINKRK